ncbi:DUF397 domain-containing protein [Actinosynnema sp. NPDC059335]|uniref:DUF397 domain-containing protein n=1 Tax=Actinosynnema sp. NPDC059335 TaxID=3346804 RepID=UPI00366D2F34
MPHSPSATARGWFKSSFSTASGDCVEVRFDGDVVRVRDSKDRGLGPVLCVGSDRWRRFTRAVRADR